MTIKDLETFKTALEGFLKDNVGSGVESFGAIEGESATFGVELESGEEFFVSIEPA